MHFPAASSYSQPPDITVHLINTFLMMPLMCSYLLLPYFACYRGFKKPDLIMHNEIEDEFVI